MKKVTFAVLKAMLFYIIFLVIKTIIPTDNTNVFSNEEISGRNQRRNYKPKNLTMNFYTYTEKTTQKQFNYQGISNSKQCNIINFVNPLINILQKKTKVKKIVKY